MQPSKVLSTYRESVFAYLTRIERSLRQNGPCVWQQERPGAVDNQYASRCRPGLITVINLMFDNIFSFFSVARWRRLRNAGG